MKVALALFAVLTASVALAQEQGREVRPNETVRFQQDKARAHMKELEERMFRLANFIREDQPDDAARLLMGVQKAREHLIADQMGQAADYIDSLQLESALEQQQEILQKLEELKRLMLTADIGLEIKLEQLRKIREARERLARLSEAEQAQRQQTDKATGDEQSTLESFQNLQPGEQRNQRSAGDLEQLIKQLGPIAAAAAGSVGSAGACMQSAAGSLAQGQGQPASQQQSEALRKLAEADETLAEAEEQLRKEVEALVRQQVMEHLHSMIALQKQIEETTLALQPRAREGSPQTLVAVRRLAETEGEVIALGAVCLELCELTEFSVVFPSALSDVLAKIQQLQGMLAEARADDDVVLLEREVIEDLEALLQALQQASRKVLDPQVANGQCMGCKGNLNKLLAELKMLRQMEQSVHRQTDRLDAELVAQQVTGAERARRAGPLGERQRAVQSALKRVQEEFQE